MMIVIAIALFAFCIFGAVRLNMLDEENDTVRFNRLSIVELGAIVIFTLVMFNILFF